MKGYAVEFDDLLTDLISNLLALRNINVRSSVKSDLPGLLENKIMFKRALHRIGTLLVSMSNPAPAAPPDQAATNKAFERHSSKLVADRLESSTPVTAGAIQLLGLKDIISTMGVTSADIIARAQGFARQAIEEQLSNEDSYDLRGGDTYVICFARNDQAAAARTAERISVRIKALVSELMPASASAITVDHFVANVDAGTLQDTRPLADQLAESLAVIRKETGKGGGSSRTSLIRDAKVRYRPMWHVKQKSISLYRCMLDTQSGSKALEHFKGMDNSNEMQMAVADLDYLVFARALKGLHALLQKKGAAIFVIPVHFRTIATKEKRKEYLKICESIPEPYRQFVAFEIYGLMANTPISRVEQFIHVLKPFCKALAIELPVNYQWIDKLANNNLWAISFDFAQTADKDAFKMPVKIVRAQSLRTIAHGVNSHNSLDTAVDTGFDYIDGTVVVGNVVTPRGTFKFSPERPPAPPTPALSR